MANLAIKGHLTRGEEVIRILEMLGGINKTEYNGDQEFAYYFINNNYIDWCHEFIPGIDFICFTLEEFLEKYPYKVGDYARLSRSNVAVIIKAMKWENNEVVYQLSLDDGWWSVNNLKPYKEETMKEKGTLVQIDLTRELCIADEVELILGDYEFVLKDDKPYFVKKKPKYPKTYEECCEVLALGEDGRLYTKGYKASLIQDFQKLLIYRNAYWKIAGEQMGLDKPWEPDWTNPSEIKYCIINTEGNIATKWAQTITNKILAFPTAEMRDVFKENFKDLIELCKEFL